MSRGADAVVVAVHGGALPARILGGPATSMTTNAASTMPDPCDAVLPWRTMP
jgi:hypothetical protein